MKWNLICAKKKSKIKKRYFTEANRKGWQCGAQAEKKATNMVRNNKENYTFIKRSDKPDG